MVLRVHSLFAALFVVCSAVGQEVPRNLFAEWDRDKDQRLTRDELPERLRGNFAKVDRDADGFISLAEHRAFVEWLRKRQGQGRARIPASVELRKDLDYVGDGNPRQKLDLLLPKDRAEGKRLPLIVFIHGGAWRAGSKEAGIGRLMPLVESGDFVGATINYRLTGESCWPTQIHDCKAAIRFLRGNAKKFGIRAKKIAVWGSSAGGHLVSMLGTSGGVEELEGELGDFDDVSSRVSCVVNYFGPQNFLTIAEQKSSINRRQGREYPEALLLGGPIEDIREAARQASPISWVSKDDPPFLTAHGSKDPLVPFAQAEEIHAALGKAAVESHLIRMQGAGHGFKSAELDRRVRAFLDSHLRGKEVEISGAPIEAGGVLRTGGPAGR